MCSGRASVPRGAGFWVEKDFDLRSVVDSVRWTLGLLSIDLSLLAVERKRHGHDRPKRMTNNEGEEACIMPRKTRMLARI